MRPFEPPPKDTGVAGPSVFQVLGILIMLLGMTLTVTGWVFVMVDAFQEHPLKGTLILVTPVCCFGFGYAYTIYYAIFEYEAKLKPWVILACFGGVAMLGMGYALFRSGAG